MQKRGGKRKNWKKRWFCLSGSFLLYYTNKSCLHHKGTILLDDSIVTPIDYGATQFSLKIDTPSRTYFLSCDTLDERNDWIVQIRLLKASSTLPVLILPSPLPPFVPSFLFFFFFSPPPYLPSSLLYFCMSLSPLSSSSSLPFPPSYLLFIPCVPSPLPLLPSLCPDLPVFSSLS